MSKSKFNSLFCVNKRWVDTIFKQATVRKRRGPLLLLSSVQQSLKSAEVEPQGSDSLASQDSLKSQELVKDGHFGMLISRKVGKAHIRNKLRRRVKALFYQRGWYKIPINSLLVAYPGAKDLDFQALTNILLVYFESREIKRLVSSEVKLEQAL